MARANIDTFQSDRRETVDLTGSAPKAESGGHLGSYLGLAIVAMILILMVFLQNSSASAL